MKKKKGNWLQRNFMPVPITKGRKHAEEKSVTSDDEITVSRSPASETNRLSPSPEIMKTKLVKSSRVIPSVSLEELTTMAKSIAESKMFGVTNEAQALALMLLCQAEGLHPVLALRRYHIIDGKPSMRADALQGEFEQVGSILWHERTEKECSATFFREKKQCTDAAVKRAKTRYKAMKAGEPTADLSEPG